MKPDVFIPPTTIDRRHADMLVTLLTTATDELHRLGAWPTTCGASTIRILNPRLLADEDPTTVSAIRTVIDFDEQNTSEPIRRTRNSSVDIEISSAFFVDDFGSRMKKMEIAESDIALHSLAHEIHHMTEAERMAACSIRYPNHRTHLAGAARADMPDDWKLALRRATECYPRFDAIKEPGLLRAGEIANEAAADLVGLHWMREADLDWKAYGRALATLRRSEFESGKKSSPALRRYETSEFIDEMVAQGLPGLQEIFSASWTRAAYEAISHDEIMASLFGSLALPLKLPVSLPASHFDESSSVASSKPSR